MDADPQHMIDNLRELREEHSLSWEHRNTLAWCVAKLLKEKGDHRDK